MTSLSASWSENSSRTLKRSANQSQPDFATPAPTTFRDPFAINNLPRMLQAVVCASALPPAGHEQRLPTPTGELHHRVLRVTASPLTPSIRPPRTGRTAPNLSRQRDNDDGRTAGPPGPRRRSYGFGRRNGLPFFTFVTLVRLILLVAQAEGVLPPSPLLGASRNVRQTGNS